MAIYLIKKKKVLGYNSNNKIVVYSLEADKVSE